MFKKEKIEIENIERNKSFKEPEKDEDFLGHDDGFFDSGIDYRDVIYMFKKLRKKILHPIEICFLAVFCGGFMTMGYFFLSKLGIIPLPIPNNLIIKEIIFALLFIVPVIILGVFFMKKTTKNILMLCGFSILGLTIAIGTTMFDIIIGWGSASAPQLVPVYLLVIFLLIISIGTIMYRFLRKRR